MIKLIASDLDGTLLPDLEQELSEKSISLIHELTLKGIHFVSASGRQYNNQLRLFDKIKDEISYIAENGTLCIHNGKIISHSPLDAQLAKAILTEVKTDGRYGITVSGDYSYYLEDKDPEFVDLIVHHMKSTAQIVPDLLALENPILKISICNLHGDENAFLDYLAHLKSIFPKNIKIVTSGNMWIDFINKDANKGTSLKTLMDLFQISSDECMVFGDQFNDIEMFQSAKYSFAMADSAPGVTKHAAYITPCVNDVLENLLSRI